VELIELAFAKIDPLWRETTALDRYTGPARLAARISKPPQMAMGDLMPSQPALSSEVLSG